MCIIEPIFFCRRRTYCVQHLMYLQIFVFSFMDGNLIHLSCRQFLWNVNIYGNSVYVYDLFNLLRKSVLMNGCLSYLLFSTWNINSKSFLTEIFLRLKGSFTFYQKVDTRGRRIVWIQGGVIRSVYVCVDSVILS